MATEVIMPRQGQSVESCILVEWLVQEGDPVTEGQPLCSIETDKAVFEVESPAEGSLLAQFFPAGEDIPVLTVIGAIGAPGEDVSGLRPTGEETSTTEAAPTSAEEAAPTEAETASAPAAPAVEQAEVPAPVAERTETGTVGVSPRARNLAASKGVALEGIAGTGPGGRVITRDVAREAANQPRMSAAARDAASATGAAAPTQGSGPAGMVLSRDIGASGASAPAAAGQQPTATEPVTVPLQGIRKIIATRMHASLAETAQITMNRSFDATALLAYRARIKAHGEGMGLPNITLNDLLAYAVVRTLQRHPALNAHFLGDRTVQYAEVNLGIATDTERGLMVPVVRGAEGMSLRVLSDAIKPLVRDAQKGSIDPDLLRGGTFTITNLGMLGVESFTPVLNVPEVAILGISGLFLKPLLAEDGSVRHVQAINLSLTVDHQVVDGAPAARFLQELCVGLEQMELLLAG